MRNLIIALALGSVAMPASAVTVVIDTGLNPAQKVTTRPVNDTTVLLGQFTILHASIIDEILAYGRVITAGSGYFGIFANNPGATSAGDTPGALLFQSINDFAETAKNAYYGVGGTGTSSLNWQLAAGTYWVGLGQTVQGNSFSSTIRGDAPAPLGNEGSNKPWGYVATNNANLSWRLSGNTIAGAVPEPATWGMMMLGFGLVGGAIRSTRRKPKVTYSIA